MKNIFSKFICLIIVNILVQSCSFEKKNNTQEITPKEYYSSLVNETQIIPGVGIGKLVIGQTRNENIFDAKFNSEFYSEKGIYLEFQNGDTLTGISLENKGQYFLKDGRKISLKENDNIKTFGQSEIKITSIKKTEIEIGELNSLNYDGFLIIYLDSTKSLICIRKDSKKTP